jgi:hypothetical protein
MSDKKQKFSTNYAKDAVYQTGLRDFMEYRDLGIADATHGRFRAHVIRVKRDHKGDQDLHTTGLHQHLCDFQMFYVLKGWIKFVYEGKKGEHMSALATACCNRRASSTTSSPAPTTSKCWKSTRRPSTRRARST